MRPLPGSAHHRPLRKRQLAATTRQLRAAGKTFKLAIVTTMQTLLITVQ
jgi:hypothetical protein